MQSKGENSIDTRTFPEIWNSLTPITQMDLRDALVSRLRVTRQTVFYWCKGQFKPNSMVVREEVSKVLSRTTGIKTNYRTLFQ